MAKSSASKGGTSKVRLIVFEAEIYDGDLSQVTQAIQNALQPRSAPVKVVQAQNATKTLIDDSYDVVDDDGIVSEELHSDTPKPRPPRTSKPRVAKTPTVINEIDVTTSPSLKDFVGDFELGPTIDKYLVIALWFRDARGIPSVTVDHIYTCFKILGWSTSANDFSKPLRNLRDDQAMKGGSKDGFMLTLPGAGKIEAKKRSA